MRHHELNTFTHVSHDVSSETEEQVYNRKCNNGKVS